MSRFLGIVALLGAGATASQQGQVNLLFPANWEPEDVAASIVDVEKSKTTFSLGCLPKATGCSIFLETMTQGPTTWIYGGEWNNIAGVDEYTLDNNCEVNTAKDAMTCTLAVTQVKDDKTLSTVRTDTTEGLGDFVYPVPITAGIHKLYYDHPKPTKTEAATTKETQTSTGDDGSTTAEPTSFEPASTSSEETKVRGEPSQSLVTTSDLVFLAPKPTKATVPESSAAPTTTPDAPPSSSASSSSSSDDAPPPAVLTPSATGENAAPAATRNAMLIGAAAVVGGAWIL